MFSRRNRFTIADRVRDFVWPRIGWRRSSAYLAHRIGRIPGTPHDIAAGFAFGAAISMTPFVGLHFVLAALLTWLLRGNVLASALGTIVGNPWTFPAIWYGSYNIGCALLNRSPGDQVTGNLTLTVLREHPLDIFLPMMTGGALLAAISWPIFYFSIRWAVQFYRSHRRRPAHPVGQS